MRVAFPKLWRQESEDEITSISYSLELWKSMSSGLPYVLVWVSPLTQVWRKLYHSFLWQKKNKKNRQFLRGESYSTLWILTSYPSGRIILIKSTRKEYKAIVLVNKRISQDVGCLSHLLQKTLNDCATLWKRRCRIAFAVGWVDTLRTTLPSCSERRAGVAPVAKQCIHQTASPLRWPCSLPVWSPRDFCTLSKRETLAYRSRSLIIVLARWTLYLVADPSLPVERPPQKECYNRMMRLTKRKSARALPPFLHTVSSRSRRVAFWVARR